MSIVDVAESFLHDCKEGESEFTEEVTNIFGENEFRELVKHARAGVEINGSTSDGYHTFDELYHHRMMLFSVICNTYKQFAWKSKLHADDTMYDNYFIVGIVTSEGDYTYHYDLGSWDMFDVKEIPKAPEWDGHKPSDITRLLSLLK